MSDKLSPEAKALLSLATSEGGASDADRLRVRSKIGAALAAGAAAGTVGAAGSAAAAAGGAAKAGGVGIASMSAVAAKGLAVIALVGGVVGGVATWTPSESSVASQASQASASERSGPRAPRSEGSARSPEQVNARAASGSNGSSSAPSFASPDDDGNAFDAVSDMAGDLVRDTAGGVVRDTAGDVADMAANTARERTRALDTSGNRSLERAGTPHTAGNSASDAADREAAARVGPPPIDEEGAGAVAPATEAASHSLDDELALLRAAQRARTSGDPQEAIRLLASHQAQYPNGMLAAERDGAAVLALCEAGQIVSARAAAQRFAIDHPSSPLAGRVLAACRD